MDKETIEARIQLLETEKNVQLKAVAATYDGAIQDCQHWLDQLNKE